MLIQVYVSRFLGNEYGKLLNIIYAYHGYDFYLFKQNLNQDDSFTYTVDESNLHYASKVKRKLKDPRT